MQEMSTEHKGPNSIGIIMDGNRRWAKERGIAQLEGHRVGYNKLREVLEWCKEHRIKYLTVYAFSTENWNRARDEVAYLLDLFRTLAKNQLENALKQKIRILFPGDRSRFPSDIQKLMQEAEEGTKEFSDQVFLIALSYGGRTEIIDAIHHIPPEKTPTITEAEFSKLLWTGNIPAPDMIIRTGGDKRLSNFLTWQSVYSELFFTDTYWPAFTKEEFVRMLEEYGERERRFGK